MSERIQYPNEVRHTLFPTIIAEICAATVKEPSRVNNT